MNKKIILIFFIQIQFCYTLTKKPWTTFFYLAGHNDLWGHLKFSSLSSLPKGANKNVNIISSAHLFARCPNIPPDNCTPTTQRFIANHKKNVQVGATKKNLNTGLQKTLIKELIFTIKIAPSKFFALFLGGHGQGPVPGICFDQKGNFLNDVDLENALKTAIRLRNKKTDILIIDCCLMASLEYYFACAKHCKFIIGSQEIDPGDGIPYNIALNSLKKSIKPKQFSTSIVNAFGKKYVNDQNQKQFTLSVATSNGILKIAKNVDNVAKNLLILLNSKNRKTVNILNITLALTTRFPGNNGGQIDLKNFYAQLIKNIKNDPTFMILKKELINGIKIIDQTIIRNETKIATANGINIFFPRFFCCQESYLNMRFNKKYPNWARFLKKYFESKN